MAHKEMIVVPVTSLTWPGAALEPYESIFVSMATYVGEARQHLIRTQIHAPKRLSRERSATAERPSRDQGAMATFRPYGRMQLM